MKQSSRLATIALELITALYLVSATEIRRQDPKDLVIPLPIESSLPTSTVALECFNTILQPTSTCSASRGTTLNCVSSIATTISCKLDKNCFKNSHNQDTCVPRNDKVAPAGIIFGIGVAVVIMIFVIALIVQRVQQKRKRRQALDDQVRGVHMGMTGSRKVEVTFVERRRREGDDEFLLHDIPPAYTESDRRRGVPSVSLNGGALPRYDEAEHGRDNRT